MRAAYGKGYCDAFTEDSPGLALPRPRVRDPRSAAVRSRRLSARLRESPGAARRRARWVSSRRGQEALSGAARHRALDRGGARGLPALHLDRGWRHPVREAERARGPDGHRLARRARRRQADRRLPRRRPPLPAPRRRRAPPARPCRSSTRAACPTCSRPAGTSSIDGKLAERHVRRRARHDGDEVPVEVLGHEAGRAVDGRARPGGARRHARPVPVRARRRGVRRLEEAPPARALGPERAHRGVRLDRSSPPACSRPGSCATTSRSPTSPTTPTARSRASTSSRPSGAARRARCSSGS